MPLANQKLAKTFLTNLGVIELFCSFRLVLEEKTGKEVPESSRLEFLDEILANNFALSDAADNMCTFGNFRKPFTMITSLSELYFRFT